MNPQLFREVTNDRADRKLMILLAHPKFSVFFSSIHHTLFFPEKIWSKRWGIEARLRMPLDAYCAIILKSIHPSFKMKKDAATGEWMITLVGYY